MQRGNAGSGTSVVDQHLGLALDYQGQPVRHRTLACQRVAAHERRMHQMLGQRHLLLAGSLANSEARCTACKRRSSRAARSPGANCRSP